MANLVFTLIAICLSSNKPIYSESRAISLRQNLAPARPMRDSGGRPRAACTGPAMGRHTLTMRNSDPRPRPLWWSVVSARKRSSRFGRLLGSLKASNVEGHAPYLSSTSFEPSACGGRKAGAANATGCGCVCGRVRSARGRALYAMAGQGAGLISAARPAAAHSAIAVDERAIVLRAVGHPPPRVAP